MTKAGLSHFYFACWKDWVPRGIAILALVLSGVGAAHADVCTANPNECVAIGQLALEADANITGSPTGLQDVLFYNNTGSGAGCQGNAGEFPVCNGVEITNWDLTITFANTGDPTNLLAPPNLLTPPSLTFSDSVGIGPYNGTPFMGGTGLTDLSWQLPLDVNSSSCPPCDYQISQIEFSGTISPGLLYTGSNPNTSNDTSFNALPTFDTVWTVPDYSSNIAGLPPDAGGLPILDYFGNSQFDPIIDDVLVSGQAASVPEPDSVLLLLFMAGTLAGAIGFMKRFHRTQPESVKAGSR